MEQNSTFLRKLIHSWINDFQILLPKNLKLFLLVTLNAVKQVYALLLRKWWWLYGALAIGNIFITLHMPTRASIVFIPLALLIFVQFIPLFILFLTVRPSVSLKSYHYYMGYYKYYILSYGSLICLMMAIFLAYPLRYPLLMINTFILSPFVIFFMFFYLDSDGSIIELLSSVYRAAVILIFHYPFILISYSIMYVLFSKSELLFRMLFFRILDDAWMAEKLGFLTAVYLLVPFIFCFYNTFYIKKVHEQFNLYFPNNNS